MNMRRYDEGVVKVRITEISKTFPISISTVQGESNIMEAVT